MFLEKFPYRVKFYTKSYPLTECWLVGKWQMVNEGGTLHNECAFYDVIGVGS